MHTVSLLLDPSGRRFQHSTNTSYSMKSHVAERKQNVELDLDLPEEVIPDTDSCTLHAMGDLVGPMLTLLVEGASNLLRSGGTVDLGEIFEIWGILFGIWGIIFEILEIIFIFWEIFEIWRIIINIWGVIFEIWGYYLRFWGW